MKLYAVTLFDKINKNVCAYLVRAADGKQGAIAMVIYRLEQEEGRLIDDYIVVNVSVLRGQ